MLASRNLNLSSDLRPVYVEVEVVGVPQDKRACRTPSVKLNQLGPQWEQENTFKFEVGLVLVFDVCVTSRTPTVIILGFTTRPRRAADWCTLHAQVELEDLALLRFGVYAEDPFNDARLVATSVAPLKYVRQGNRFFKAMPR